MATELDHERKPVTVEKTLSCEDPTSEQGTKATQLEEDADISLDDLVGHISLMLPKFETHMGTPKNETPKVCSPKISRDVDEAASICTPKNETTKKLTSWARAQEKKPVGWRSITANLTTETSLYPMLGTVSVSPSTVLCTIEDSDIKIGNIDSKCTEELITAANDDCSDDWIGYTGYETIDYSES